MNTQSRDAEFQSPQWGSTSKEGGSRLPWLHY